MAEDSRPRAYEIYERVAEDGRVELERPAQALAFSGIFSGITIGLSGLSAAATLTLLGSGGGARFAASALYPIGFVAVILGRAQLFTENTLYPVVVALDDRRQVLPTLRLWVIVFTTNMVGALLFALLAVETRALSGRLQQELITLGHQTMAGPFWPNFWSGVVAGWIIALIAWLVEAVDAAIGRFVVIASLAFVVGLGSFDHSVASAAEALATTVNGAEGVGAFLGWLAAVTVGNIVGGVFIVTILNYGQVRGLGAAER